MLKDTREARCGDAYIVIMRRSSFVLFALEGTVPRVKIKVAYKGAYAGLAGKISMSAAGAKPSSPN
jgi:hypothetical protein